MTDFIDKEKIEQAYKLIDNAQYAVISLAKDNEPYGIPISVVRNADSLYFHTGQQGQKIDFLNTNSKVNLTFVGEVNIPNLYDKDQANQMAADPSKHGKFVNTVFTTNFESVIVKGESKEIIDDNQKIEAMRAICQKYTPKMMDYFDIPIKRSLGITKVFKIEIKDLRLRKKQVKI